MSASLVGSEMCIRDSPPPTQLKEPRGRETVRRGGHKWQPLRSTIHGSEHCLLYTSDAADDM
eukprot:2840036-Alexandrium_andersonii.AAC.1